MFCEHCGETNGDLTGVDHDERDCPWLEEQYDGTYPGSNTPATTSLNE